MAKHTEEIVTYTCDFCGDDIDTKGEPLEFKGKHFCYDCWMELEKKMAEYGVGR